MCSHTSSHRSLASRITDAGKAAADVTQAKINMVKATGVDVLELSGTPASLPGQNVLEAARQSLFEKSLLPAAGIVELRQAISDKLSRENSIEAEPETQIVITNGAMGALNVVATSLLNPGDEVLLPSPCFYGFTGLFKLAGAVPVFAPMCEADGWRLDIERLQAKVTPRTRLLCLCTPVNPTGYVFTKDDIDALAMLVERHDLWILSDESYEKQVYDGRVHLSPAAHPGLRNRTATVHSFTKSYGMRAFRIGYVVAPDSPVGEAMRRVAEWMVLAVNYTSQRAALAALTGPQDWVERFSSEFQEGRDTMTEGIRGLDGVSHITPLGGPNIFLKVSELGLSPEEFAEHLLKDFGVPTISGSEFGDSEHVRLQFGGTLKTVEEAVHRLNQAIPALRGGGQ